MNSIPPDILERFGYLPDHRHRGGNEHSSACPECGGARGGSDPSDRFRFWERPGQASNFWCRRCGFSGFADDNRPGMKPDPARIQELEEIRQREAAKEAARLQDKIDELQRAAYWQGYHDAMTQKHREMWRQAGIIDSFQDHWQLGYKEYHGIDFTSPALTIPYFAPGWEAFTIQYRLLQPPEPSDKYRFQAGLKSGVWLADPDEVPSGAVLLCEGMKKAAVTYIRTTASGIGKFSVVAVPSKMPGREIFDELKQADPLYICLDPDAYTGKSPAINRIVKMVDNPKRIVKLPCKADDFFTLYGGDGSDFIKFTEMAVKV